MSDDFDEVLFPLNIALGSLGGPRRNTEIVSLASGYEQRNTRWKHSRRAYNAGYGMKHAGDLYNVVEFFEERRGRLRGFRFRDPMDHKSSLPEQVISFWDQYIGTGDGERSEFQLIKTYGAGSSPYVRKIHKPVVDSVKLAVDGAVQSEGVSCNVDHVSGVVSFFPGHIPAAGQVVSAGYLFDVPVRFETDEISVNLQAFEAGQIPSIPLMEVLL